MKTKSIAILVGVLFCGIVQAEWVEITMTYEGTITVYVDPTTIRKSGNNVKMWRLADFNSVQEDHGDKFLSSKSQHEFDCKEEQKRTLYFSWHSENMGGGDVVYIGDEPQKNWSPVAPNTIGRTIWEFACGK